MAEGGAEGGGGGRQASGAVSPAIRRFVYSAVETISGPTSARPQGQKPVGMMYFDTTLGKPIWWKGSGWVDAAGATA